MTNNFDEKSDCFDENNFKKYKFEVFIVSITSRPEFY